MSYVLDTCTQRCMRGLGGGEDEGYEVQQVTKHTDMENLESDKVISAVLLSCVARGDKRCG